MGVLAKGRVVVFLVLALAIAVVLLSLHFLSQAQAIDSAANYSFVGILSQNNIDSNIFAESMLSQVDSLSPVARADTLLAVGRITNNKSMICEAVSTYESMRAQNNEEEALLHETIASLGCGRSRTYHLLVASLLWQRVGNSHRAGVDRRLSLGLPLELRLQNDSIPLQLEMRNASRIVIGSSVIVVSKNDVLLSQVDRVSRDWLGLQLNSSPFDEQVLTTFSERLTYSEAELLPEVGWHEGGRIKEISRVGLKRMLGVGTLLARINGTWYAPDERGIFRFEVPEDKALYPTNRFLLPNLAVVMDTHGVNMLVEQAVRLNASVVVGCCDHPGKVKAARYLAQLGKKVVCFTDRFVPLLLGQNITVLGSPPLRSNGSAAIIGSQPVSIGAGEIIVVEGVDNYSGVPSYYDTPARYFRLLESAIPLRTHYFMLKGTATTWDLVGFAEEMNATVIAARVFSLNDYNAMKSWLGKDRLHRAILFHSSPYPYGLRLLLENRNQTTFDDINPIFK